MFLLNLAMAIGECPERFKPTMRRIILSRLEENPLVAHFCAAHKANGTRPNELNFFGRFGLYGSHEKGRGGLILCISYTSRAFGSIKFEAVKIDDLDCERLFRLLNNSAPVQWQNDVENKL